MNYSPVCVISSEFYTDSHDFDRCLLCAFASSGADLAALVREASVQILKEFMNSSKNLQDGAGTLELKMEHFERAFAKLRPSVSLEVLSTMFICIAFCLLEFYSETIDISMNFNVSNRPVSCFRRAEICLVLLCFGACWLSPQSIAFLYCNTLSHC